MRRRTACVSALTGDDRLREPGKYWANGTRLEKTCAGGLLRNHHSPHRFSMAAWHARATGTARARLAIIKELAIRTDPTLRANRFVEDWMRQRIEPVTE